MQSKNCGLIIIIIIFNFLLLLLLSYTRFQNVK